MQIGVGSGVKVGVCVWKALREVRDVHSCWEHCVSSEERKALVARRRDGAGAPLSTLTLLLALAVLVVAVVAAARLALSMS